MNGHTSPFILVVDDEPAIRELIQDILEDEGYQVATAGSGQEAKKIVDQRLPSLILLDIWMPDIDGISLLKTFKERHPHLTIIMMSGHGTIESAIEATKLGAAGFIEKPLSTAKLLREVDSVHQQKSTHKPQHSLQGPIGKSPEVILLKKQAQRVAQHNMPILLIGEDGTGKRYLARYLHTLGMLSSGRFVELNPDSFPLDYLKFLSIAENNCVYINHLAQLSEKAQTLLLHLLEQEKLGKSQLIFANESRLDSVVTHGTFNEALFYEINSITLSLPKLADRIEDIPDLVHHFVDQYTSENDLPYRHFTVAAQNRLRHYPWPGNLSELQNVIQRLLVLSEHNDIDESDIELALAPIEEEKKNSCSIDYEKPLREAREQFERIYLTYKLQQTEGNVGKAAKLAGMERTHLYRKLRALQIDSKQAQEKE